MESAACKQIRVMAHSASPKVRTMARALLDPNRTVESMLRAWHEGMGAPVKQDITMLSAADLERRLRLTLEENLETVKASGFTIISKSTGKDVFDDLQIVPRDGTTQDLELIADGLADTAVVTIGHAIEHGFPFIDTFVEAMLSNGTKLPEDGNTIFNRCIVTDTDASHDCAAHTSDCKLIDPTAPVNKILKPSTYVKADFAAVLAGQIDDNCGYDTVCDEVLSDV